MENSICESAFRRQILEEKKIILHLNALFFCYDALEHIIFTCKMFSQFITALEKAIEMHL
jgi:flavorubredoxin